jgi:hypothetical protein
VRLTRRNKIDEEKQGDREKYREVETDTDTDTGDSRHSDRDTGTEW